jgi:hypothetical protein
MLSDLLKLAETKIREATWVRTEPMSDVPAYLEAIFWMGRAGDWNITVSSFSIEEQGFPVGSRGYDGFCTFLYNGAPIVLRLPHELAEFASDVASHGGIGAEVN